MQKAFLLVVAAGAGIGLMWPSDRSSAPIAPAVSTPAAAAEDGAEAPRETVLERSRGGHFYADVEVNGELVHFIVDTGASGIALTERDAERVGLRFDRSAYEQVGSGASGPVRGKFVTLAKVNLDGKAAHNVDGTILEGSEISLLGQNYLGRYSIEIRGDTMRIY
ncbi:MAG TPA: TIGR02281 family clan AA aspartic protease [Allosphingosinicella sp.]|nr:TIGR02281 family clan AA aspartic protease [Allosphingosinicella sp.]